MKVDIREIRPGEATELKKLACSNFSIVEQLFMSKPKLGVVAQTADGQIAGGAFLVISETHRRKVGCIDIIFVLPEYRGSGIAKQLYHAAAETLHRHGCETVMALVRGDNSPSLLRFESEGLYLTSLCQLCRRIGVLATVMLFIKTASLACATGCWILCEGKAPDSPRQAGKNLLGTFLVNGFILSCGALVGILFQTTSTSLWNLLAGLFLLGMITLGETMGRRAAGGNWHFVMPEGGLVPSTVIALLGGFYPMLGHWYLTKRENTDTYRRRMAAPAKGAWLLLMIITLICGVLNKMHPFFSSTADMGVMLLLFYVLPFYPFDTFGSRRIRESSRRSYAIFVTLTILTLALITLGILLSIATLLGKEI